MLNLAANEARIFYDASRKWFTIVSIFVCPVLLVINAPFGRFAPSGKGLFNVDGRISWIVMEIVSPIMFTLSFLSSPLSRAEPVAFGPSSAQHILAAAYLIHYANRAVISPLRTPSRSKSNIIVPLSGVAFNILNGSLMGTYLSSPAAFAYLCNPQPSFYLGLGLWVAGFVGNIIHDEILLNLRRKSNATGKISDNRKNDERRNLTNEKTATAKSISEHYAIPYGLLYKYVSYPNYLCEWAEWLGFALAASPLPFATISHAGGAIGSLLSPSAISTVIRAPSSLFEPRLTPPWIFVLNEIVLMLPRAYRGHQWYKEKFGQSYPKERKAVVPFIL
ncbi:hypothetical protein D9757_003006 [Collybiopsis confluens]|uniref:3-oxo-5-alpha-steroid 4-dehydrogenase C-terminal domain-containing protein n=1 Tax=Collybiopsis confluens TaxID=2823264 RepID=A0A8H5HX28_9AGAR|nr:hypothetical protein D9757_003006 [Collybiopsis confluens]